MKIKNKLFKNFKKIINKIKMKIISKMYKAIY